jgi:hypothetical protein
MSIFDDDDPKPVKTTSTSAPWGPVQAPLTTGINDFFNLYKSGGLQVDRYPRSTVAPVAPERNDAWSMIADRAKSGSPLMGGAKDYFSSVLRGDKLNAEAPGFAQVLERAKQAVNGNYALGGRYGSGAHDDAVTSALSPIIYDNYQTERGYQDSAARFAPAFAEAEYSDADRLNAVGKERQAQMQAQLDDSVAAFDWNENKQINAIDLLRKFLTGANLGGSSSGTQPGVPGNNNFLDFLGTALQAGAGFAGK